VLMLVVRCGGVRKNRKRGFVVFRNCRWALDFGAMLRAGDFSEIWQEPDVHNSFFPAKIGIRDWGLVAAGGVISREYGVLARRG